MTEIDSTITFENGQITKCVLQIGGKTFTVTLDNKGYEVKEGGTAPCSTPGSAPVANAHAPVNPGSNSSTSTPAPANADASAPPAPLKQEKYNTQEDLIEKLGQYDYKPVK
jgi:hypothetical protein